MKRRFWIVLGTVSALSACSFTPKDTSPTLKSLEKRSVPIESKTEVVATPEKAKQTYENLLRSPTADEQLRSRAMRRLADLEMQEKEDIPGVDTQKAAPAAAAGPDFQKAITLYEGLLKSYPDNKDNDRILYQLARAYEQVGELEKSLDTLTILVEKFPQSVFFDESQFRRGELLFTFQDFAGAEKAYQGALQLGRRSPFYERATYKHGWSVYKQDRYRDALPSFMALLELKLANKRLGDNVAEYDFLSRGDKELVQDAFRVVSLCFSYLEGPASIKEFFAKREPANFEFLVYRGLGDLYLRQERYVDAGQAYAAFADAHPEHPQSLLMQIDAIELFQERGFFDRVIDGKKHLVDRYGKYVEFWASNTHYGFDQYLMRSDTQLEQKIEEYVVSTLEELGKYYHGRAQKSKNPLDYQEAIRWYQTFLRTFLQHPKSPEINFLLAEAQYEDKRYGEAIREYEKTAYNYTRHKQAADAGYAALLAYEEYKKSLSNEDLEFWSRLSLQSAERFSKLFPKDPRTPGVLVKVVTELFEKKQFEQATVFAQRILVLAPDAEPKVRAQAMSIIAHTHFENNRYKEAEEMYAQILQATPRDDKNRQAVEDRLAASIYKQGEALRDQGDLDGSTSMFLKVASAAPGSAIRATAEYDAAANLVNLKEWTRAIPLLEDFQRNHPNHQLQADVTNKLAVAYLESGSNSKAADYLQKIAANEKDKTLQLGAVWQAAELYEKDKAYESAVATYKRLLRDYSPPPEQAIEARQRVVDLYGKLGQPNSQRAAQKEILATVKPTVPNLTDRERFVAANAALALAEPVYNDFHAIRLTAPLKESVARKKKAMDEAIKAFNLAAEYRQADVTTASTYRIGQLYSEFSKAILDSERPKGLSDDALEQYELVLEEQAFPLEEKAIEIHEANAGRVGQGVYDDWVKKSFAALAGLLPARYGKVEKVETVIDEIN